MIYKYGIDFGTTNSSIAIRIADEGESEHTIVVDVKDTYPRETLPSIACITENGKIVVGNDAYQQLRFSRSCGEKAQLIKKIKLDLEMKGPSLQYSVGNKVFLGIDIIAEMLKYLRLKAERDISSLGVQTSGVVLGVPVQYGDIQKNALKDALFKAGFYKCVLDAEQGTEFVSEPVAVAVHYGLNTTDDKTVLVFDFGGGTLDLAIVNLKNQVGIDHLHPHKTISKVRITLGGEELTRLFFTKTFCDRSKYGTDKICSKFHLARILTPDELWDYLLQDEIGTEFLSKVEQCKCALSSSKKFDFSFIGPNNIIFESRKIFREEFEEAIEPIKEQIRAVIDECLQKGGIDDIYEIDHVIIAGGSSLIPCVQDMLMDRFGRFKVCTRPGATHAVSESEVLTSIVRGLAAVGCRKESLIDDVVDNNYGLWDDVRDQFMCIIKSGIPVKETTFDRLSQEGISKDVKCASDDQTSVTIKVFQSNNNGLDKLGTIIIDDAGGKRYRVFMSVDPKQGKLEVNLYDSAKRRWIDDIPLNQRQYDISKLNLITKGN